jgi:hypothetical protein
MKRFTVLALLATAAFAASQSETTTYVDGNVKGLAPKTGGTLVLSDEKSMVFRTGLTNVEVPYSGIDKVELGAVKETSHAAPIYKVWKLHQRLNGANKTETQLLILNYKNADGEDHAMTLELAEAAVQPVVSTLEQRTGKTFAADKKEAAANRKSGAKQAKNNDGKPAEWWGDDYWKTPRNSGKWDKAAGSNNNNN